MTALTLTGCNSGSSKAGSLPKGGKEVDITTDAGKETLKQRLGAAIDSYADLDLKSASLTAKAAMNEELDASATVQGYGKFALNVQAKDVKGEATIKAAEKDGKLEASIESKAGGSVTLKGEMPGKEEGKQAKLAASISLKDVKFASYISGSKVYVDASAVEGVAGKAESFVNDLLKGAKDSMIGDYLPALFQQMEGLKYDADKNTIDLKGMVNEALPEKKFYVDMGQAVEWPTLKIEKEQVEQIKAGLDQVVPYFEQFQKMGLGITFKTYSGNGFGFELAITKDSIKALVSALAGDQAQMINSYVDMFVTKLDLSAAIYFNKSALLESVSFKYDIDAGVSDISKISPDAAQMIPDLKVSLKSSGSLELSAKYNGVKVSLPNLSSYKELKVN